MSDSNNNSKKPNNHVVYKPVKGEAINLGRQQKAPAPIPPKMELKPNKPKDK